MKKATRVLIVFVVLAGATVAGVWVKRGGLQPGAAVPGAKTSAARDGGVGPDAAARMPRPTPDGSERLDASTATVTRLDDRNKDAGATLLDGASVPTLTEGPKTVVFGVVLVQYRGAQGARAGTRSFDEARSLADHLAELARDDFEAAVKKGDPGSTDNAGRMFRDILEPAPEYVLFSLEKGEVGGPVDTPRGFWIVKRIE